ncbi:MAG: pilus assembly protein PilP [Oligoflexia bacterium]|nr:pilus assembly protein PilP [Oligoflexia bacterium]
MKKLMTFFLCGLVFTSLYAQEAIVEPTAPAEEIKNSEVHTQDESKLTSAAKVEEGPLAGIIENYSYNPSGRKDPFLPYQLKDVVGDTYGPELPLQKYDLDQLRLVGVIWDVANPKAMIMDASQKGHVVKVNDRIGRNNGYVARIREGEIVVVESFKGLDGKTMYQTQVMKLSSE